MHISCASNASEQHSCKKTAKLPEHDTSFAIYIPESYLLDVDVQYFMQMQCKCITKSCKEKKRKYIKEILYK